MTSRERVLTSVQHKEPDRVPLFYRDVPEVQDRLLTDLGLQSREELLRHLQIDFRLVGPRYVGPSLGDKKSGCIRDIWGVEHSYMKFSEAGGYWEVTSSPLAKCEDPAMLKDYAWPSLEWFDFSGISEQIKKHDGYAIMTDANHASRSVLFVIQALCGNEKAWADMLVNPELSESLIQHIMDFNLQFIEKMLTAANDKIDFFRTGDDFGMQNGLLIGPDLYQKFLHPALKAMGDLAKQHGAYYYHHTCGGVRKLIPELIRSGVDILDPLQVKATGMVPAELKAEFGQQLCFSGGVDEQELLPRGTPEQVRLGVRSLLDEMAPGGGFFIGPTHNLQVDIPTENVVAMYQAAKEWPN